MRKRGNKEKERQHNHRKEFGSHPSPPSIPSNHAPSPNAIPLNHAPSRAHPRSRLLSHVPLPLRLRSPGGRGVGHTSARRRQRAGAASAVQWRARVRWSACELRQAAALLHSSQIPAGSGRRAAAGGWLRCAMCLRLATGPRARLVRRSGHQVEPEWRTAAAACGAPGPCCQQSAAGLPLPWGFYFFFFFWGGFLTFFWSICESELSLVTGDGWGRR